MNYASKYRENKRLIQGYVDFLNECTTFDEKLKLSAEITRLSRQNEQINKMEYATTKRDISDYTITANSKINRIK